MKKCWGCAGELKRLAVCSATDKRTALCFPLNFAEAVSWQVASLMITTHKYTDAGRFLVVFFFAKTVTTAPRHVPCSLIIVRCEKINSLHVVCIRTKVVRVKCESKRLRLPRSWTVKRVRAKKSILKYLDDANPLALIAAQSHCCPLEAGCAIPDFAQTGLTFVTLLSQHD